jgi:hypothetical protein
LKSKHRYWPGLGLSKASNGDWNHYSSLFRFIDFFFLSEPRLGGKRYVDGPYKSREEGKESSFYFFYSEQTLEVAETYEPPQFLEEESHGIDKVETHMVDTEEKGNMLFLISFSYLTGRLSSRQ